MKAAVWYGRQDVRIQEVPDPPPPPPGQVQVAVSWCGICGTDLHEFLGGPLYIPVDQAHPLTGVRAPVGIGHEISGTVEAVGDGIEHLHKGDRIAACPIIGCGSCRWCSSDAMAQCDRVAFLGTSWTGGGFAERVNLWAYQCYRLPPEVSDEAGALVEPFSSAVRAVLQGHPTPESSVAVVGAGPIGLMAIIAARILGAGRVIAVEMAERRMRAAIECGAEAVIDPSRNDPEVQARRLTEGQGFDLVVECAGQPATALLAAKLTRTRGQLIFMGVFEKPTPLDITDVVFREKTIRGSMSGYGLYEQSIRMVTDRQFRADELITDRIPLDDLIKKGYYGLLNEKDKHIKVLVRPV